MDHFSSIIGQSPALDSLIRSAKIAASTDVTILLKGETGTGKWQLSDSRFTSESSHSSLTQM